MFPLFQKGIDAKMKELTQAGIGKFFICIIYQCKNTNFIFRRDPPRILFLYQEKMHFSHKRYRYIENVKLQLMSYIFSFCFALFFFLLLYFFFYRKWFSMFDNLL